MGISDEDLALMRRLDELYTRLPFYGIRRMTAELRKERVVNHKRVTRLLRQMELMAIYPKPRLSVTVPGHRIYPYLRGAGPGAGAGPTGDLQH